MANQGKFVSLHHMPKLKGAAAVQSILSGGSVVDLVPHQASSVFQVQPLSRWKVLPCQSPICSGLTQIGRQQVCRKH